MATLTLPAVGQDSYLFNDTTFGTFTVNAGCVRLAPNGYLTPNAYANQNSSPSTSITFKLNDGSEFIPGSIGLAPGSPDIIFAGLNLAGQAITYQTISGSGFINIPDKTPIYGARILSKAGGAAQITGFVTGTNDTSSPTCLSITLVNTVLV